MKLKSPPSLPILKESRYSNLTQEAKDNGNKDKVYIGVVLLFLCLMIDVLSDRDYIEQCRLVLTRLIAAIKHANPNAVVAQYEAQPQHLGRENTIPWIST